MQTSRTGLALAAAGLLLAGDPAHAQQSAGGASTLEEIIVTAAKREEKLHDVAMSVTAVGGDDLQRRVESAFADYAAQVPGLSLQAVTRGANRVILRGQNVGSAGATIATTVDDTPFFMSGAQADGNFLSANVDTYDLQRIEVLRGPQGTLYGAAAEGGLVKYVTNPPDPQGFAAEVVAGGGWLSHGSSTVYGKGMVNLPFWSEKAALRVSGTLESLPGWVDNTLLGVADENSGDKYSVRASLLVEPTEDFTIRLTAFNQKLTLDGSDSVQVVGAALTPQDPPPDKFDTVDGLSHEEAWPYAATNRLEYYALSIDYDFAAARLMSATSYGEISYRWTQGYQDTNLLPGVTYGDYFAAVVYGQPIIFSVDEQEFVEKFNQELRLTSRPGSMLFAHAFDWQLGGFYTRETTALIQPYSARPLDDPSTVLAPPVGGAEVPGYYQETAFFVDATYHFSDAFDVELGGRHTSTQQHSQVSFSCCVLFGPADMVFETQYFDETGDTWSLAPRWHVSDDTLVYARVATGFRPGGPNFPTPTLPDPPPFLSDSTTNYELGVRTRLGGRLAIDIAAFYIDWTDIQILALIQTETGPVGINGNSGSATSQGLEWNLEWRPNDHLGIGLLGAYTDAKLDEAAPGLGADKGDELPYVPDLSATLNVDFQWSAFGGFTGYVGGSASYVGTRHTSFSPTSYLQETHVKLPSYETVKLQLGIDDGRYSAQLYVNNLTDERGINDYSSMGGHDQTGLAKFIQPRTIGVQVGAKF